MVVEDPNSGPPVYIANTYLSRLPSLCFALTAQLFPQYLSTMSIGKGQVLFLPGVKSLLTPLHELLDHNHRVGRKLARKWDRKPGVCTVSTHVQALIYKN